MSIYKDISDATFGMMLVQRYVLYDIHHLVAGGYARDLAHGRKPKDADFWVDAGDTSEVLDKIRRRLAKMPFDYVEHDAYDSPDHDQRRERVAVFSLDCSVDIIVSDEPPIESVKKFDFNLNHYIMDDGEPVFVGEDHPRNGLVQVSPDVRSGRVARMIRLWQELYGDNV